MIEITKEIKAAMLAKDTVRLTTLRAIKSAFMLAQTEKGAGEMTEEAQLKIIQKQLKQRKDAATIYQEQGREDLAQDELDQAAVLQSFLPEPLSEEELEKAIAEIITQVGASSIADMGKVMGLASKQLSAKADGKVIASKVRAMLV